ncbi:peptidase S8/S53 domain-containing protein [Mycena sp. CBHHK59/15]|nr:peptidase S8/S53 domain-containing protein [Mycena sp. CBHHK59/15]
MYTYDWSFPRKAEWGQNVVVYVIDSGVRASHVQFRGGQVEEGYTIPRFKGTGPGNVPLGHHGTGVASVIGGQTSGMATLATIVPIKVAGETTNEVPETSDDVAEAIKIAEIDWVVRQKMNPKLKAVVNISWTIRNNAAAEKAIANAVAADMHIIIAAGNSDFHVDECFGQTTGKDERVSDQGQITVAFTWYDDNYGGNAGPCVDVLAPSTNMLVAGDECDTCCHNGEYSSFSAPQVAGLVASILSTSDVHISPAEMRDLIRTKYSIAGHLIGVIPALTTDRLLQSPLQMHPPQ